MATVRIGGIRVDMSLGTAELEKGLKKVEKLMSGLGSTLKTGLAVGGFVVAEKSIESLTRRLVTLADRASRVGDLKDAFSALGGSFDWVDKAQNSLLGTVSASDLLVSANKMLVAGMKPTADQFANLAVYADRYASATGGDTVSALTQLSTTIAKGSAARLDMLGFHITGKTLAERQAQALDQLKTKLDALPAIADNTSNAAKNLGNAWGEAQDKMGTASNSNDTLRDGLKELADACRGVDLTTLINALSDFCGLVIGTTAEILKMVNALNNWLNLGGAIKNTSLLGDLQSRSMFKTMGDDIANASYEFYKLDNYGQKTTETYKTMAAALEKVKAGVTAKGGWAPGATEEIASMSARLKEFKNDIVPTPGGAGNVFTKTGLDVDGMAKKMDEAAKALDDLKLKWAAIQSDNAKSKLDDAIDAGDFAGARGMIGDYAAQVQSETLAGLQDAMAKAGPEGEVLGHNIAIAYADKAVVEINTRIKDALTRAHEEAVQKWTDVFANAMMGGSLGGTDDWQTSVQQLMSGAAAQIVAAFETGSNDITKSLSGLQGLGQFIGQAVYGASAAPIGQNTDGTYIYADDSKGSQEIAGYAQAAFSVIGDWMKARDRDKAAGDKSGTGQAAGSTGGTAVGAYFGGAQGAQIGGQIGGLFGKFIGAMFGSMDVDTKARRAFDTWLKDLFGKLSTVGFIGNNGKMTLGRGKDFSLDMSGKQFSEDWGDKFAKTAGANAGAFAGLGQALKELAGITEDVGAQIGAVLAEQLSGNLDNARLLVYQLGLSFEDLAAALETAAKKGTISWAEYNVELAGVADATKPGIAALGDYASAFENLINSGGRGLAATKSVRDTFIEAIEAGITDYETLRQKLIEAGADPELVNALIDQAIASGKTIKELSAASDTDLGVIVGNMELTTKKLGDIWAEMGANLDGLNEKLRQLPEKIDSTVNVTVNGIDELERAIALQRELDGGGGVKDPVKDPSVPHFRAGMGIVMPPSGIHSRMGGRAAGFDSPELRQTVYQIDARGASPGVEQRVMAAIKQAERRAEGRAVSRIARSFR